MHLFSFPHSATSAWFMSFSFVLQTCICCRNFHCIHFHIIYIYIYTYIYIHARAYNFFFTYNIKTFFLLFFRLISDREFTTPFFKLHSFVLKIMSVFLSICLSQFVRIIYLSIFLFISLSLYLSIYLSIFALFLLCIWCCYEFSSFFYIFFPFMIFPMLPFWSLLISTRHFPVIFLFAAHSYRNI